MGAGVSEVVVERCHPSCIAACPGIAEGSELRRRQVQLEMRRANSNVRFPKVEKPVEVEDDEKDMSIMKRMSKLGDAGSMRNSMSNAFFSSVGDGELEEGDGKATGLNPDEMLHQAARRGDMRRARRSFEKGANIAVTNARGATALMLAASSSGKDPLDIVEELVKQKAETNTRDHNGWTALHHAARNGKTEIVKMLLAMEADPTLLTADNKTSLMLATLEGKNDLVKELLKIKTVSDQIGEKDALGATALHFGVKEGSIDVVKLLLEQGAKVNTKDIDGRLPLMWACEHGKLECAKQLVKRSADIDCKDKGQKTPLLYACTNSWEGVALWLVKKGADPHFRDLEGDTPLLIADENGLSEFKRAIKLRRELQDEAAFE